MKKKYRKVIKKDNSETIIEFEWGSKKQIIIGIAVILILIAFMIVKVVG